MNRINILIGKIVDDAPGIGPEENPISTRFTGVPVYVRDGYSALSASATGNRPVSASVHCKTRWSDTAISNRGTPGAFVVDVPEGAVEAAVAQLRDAWGADTPVQDNSRRYPHLATVAVWR